MRKTISCLLLAGAVTAASPAAASDKSWKNVADIGLAGIGAADVIFTLAERDHNGAVQLAESTLAAFAVTEGLKYAVNERRPNGGNHSFPSGHATLAFAGAGYVFERYGWKAGVPLELVATVVGVARVKSHDHHWYDVVAGAAIGTGSAVLFTHRLNENARLSLGGDSQGGIVQVAARF